MQNQGACWWNVFRASRLTLRSRAKLFLVSALIAVTGSICGCRGGGNSSGSLVPPPPDFSLSFQPGSISLVEGSFSSLTVSVTSLNGFTSQTNIRLTGIPAGVTATPVQFTLNSGGQQSVTLQAVTT